MIVLKAYQKEAVQDLSENIFKLLRYDGGGRKTVVFKAPTGAGKTVMMASFLNSFCEELSEKTSLKKRKAAFIWIAPNKLYIQSYHALKGYFAEMRSLKPIFYEDIIGDELMPNEVLFVNWESINKEKNTIIRENETGKSLYNFIDKARANNTEIIVIIDEEHMFANPKTAKRANEVLQRIYPKIEIRVSATPISNSDYKTTVERQDVVAEEMIKEGIILNPVLDKVVQGGRDINTILLDQALEKREELKSAYQQLDLKINPLLLIQLPNDTSDSNTAEDEKYIDVVLANLDAKGINVKNNKLAVWLSGKKDNLEGIEKPDNMVEVLLFKQAIALGWDCPRAGVLLIFRELQSTTFTIQTVGRILRMPEQKYYPDAVLNQGYVFTNLSKDVIQIVRDDMSYITMNKAIRMEDYQEVRLNSSYINTKIVRNRLGASFRKVLYEVAEKHWGLTRVIGETYFIDYNRKCLQQALIELNVESIEIAIPENMIFSGDLEVKSVVEKARFAKTQAELNQLFYQFCRENVHPFAPVDSTPVLEMALKLFFEEYLGFDNNALPKIILYSQNQPKFIEFIAFAIERYIKLQEEKANNAKRDVQTYTWEVPSERIYNDLYEEKPVEKHVLTPLYELIEASKPERRLVEFLEENKAYLLWWYKNGDKGKEHFAVSYTNNRGIESLFYVDFIIRTNSGVTCLFDTKTEGSDAANAHLKHNALIDFIAKRNKEGMKTVGGILIGRDNNGIMTFRYCSNKITDTNDLKGWDFFTPSTI